LIRKAFRAAARRFLRNRADFNHKSALFLIFFQFVAIALLFFGSRRLLGARLGFISGHCWMRSVCWACSPNPSLNPRLKGSESLDWPIEGYCLFIILACAAACAQPNVWFLALTGISAKKNNEKGQKFNGYSQKHADFYDFMIQ